MRLIEVPVSNLQPGMFVAELDRPWLDTPFALQGFVVRDKEDLLYIAKYVDYVFVDVEYSGAQSFLPRSASASTENPLTATVENRLKIKAEFQQARISFESAEKSLDRVFDSISKGRQTDIKIVKDSIQPLLNDVFRNQDAVAALVRLKETSEYRYNHGISMAVWAAILGRHIGMDREKLEKLVVGCALCDLGMTKLPKELIEQSGSLTDEQCLAISEHPLIGAKMVSNTSEADHEILAIIESHHERHDGSGYPRGLEGSNIPMLAKIAGLVDAYDAMITPRPHAAARSSYEAIQELIDSKGQHFQNALVEQFVQAIGLFPTGSLVELNNGEVAIVVKQNVMRRLKPEIVIVLDCDKNRKSPYELCDLSNADMLAADARWIVRELKHGTYGIKGEEFFI
jgi:HD-GYP domain-containing protein (c-di-GMP phosphodiesterase class II)